MNDEVKDAHKYVVFFGPQGAGKTTLAHGFAQVLRRNGLDPKVCSMATVLREMFAPLFAGKLPPEFLNLGDKDRMIPMLGHQTSRFALQKMGAFCRAHFGQDVFIHAIALREFSVPQKEPKIFLLDDVRYNNEREYFWWKGAKFIRVYGEIDEKNLSESHKHESEQDWRKWTADLEVVNSPKNFSTLRELSDRLLDWYLTSDDNGKDSDPAGNDTDSLR